MKLSIRLLQGISPPHRHKKWLEILEQECQREIKLIDDLLLLQDFVEDPIPLSAIDLSQWLPDVAEGFQELALSKGVVLSLSFPPDLPQLHSYPELLQRIVTQLLDNACKFTPSGGAVHLTVTCNDQVCTLEVVNRGAIIDPAYLDRVFEPFFRIPRRDAWSYSGTGVGLAVVKKLVLRLKGQISVTSADNETCFRVEIPMSTSS
jgi:signal transduction histidine kinase